jgi:hypothetical protein
MRPSLRDSDIRAQGGHPAPRELHIGPWIGVAVIIGLLILFL